MTSLRLVSLARSEIQVQIRSFFLVLDKEFCIKTQLLSLGNTNEEAFGFYPQWDDFKFGNLELLYRLNKEKVGILFLMIIASLNGIQCSFSLGMKICDSGLTRNSRGNEQFMNHAGHPSSYSVVTIMGPPLMFGL
ncbi:hypothetical protein GQ457_05G006360 [Hibiscus cannabinus]